MLIHVWLLSSCLSKYGQMPRIGVHTGQTKKRSTNATPFLLNTFLRCSSVLFTTVLMILTFLFLDCATPAGKTEGIYMGHTKIYLRGHSVAKSWTVETEKCTSGFPTFILEVDISPLHFVKPSFLLRQVRCSLRTTLSLDCLEELT